MSQDPPRATGEGFTGALGVSWRWVGWEPEATGYAWGLQELADAGVDWGWVYRSSKGAWSLQYYLGPPGDAGDAGACRHQVEIGIWVHRILQVACCSRSYLEPLESVGSRMT